MVECRDDEDSPVPEPGVVAAFERELGVTLPADFVDVATTHPGASPEPGSIDVPGFGGTSIDKLLTFDEDDGDNLLSRQWMAQEGLGPGVVPFAVDIGGDLFCFDYRDDPAAPTAGFWSVDTGYVRLAGSFTELVAMLRPVRSQPVRS